MSAPKAPGWKTIQDPEASDPLKRYRHREVVVHANGVQYQGVLVGADEEEIYLRMPTRFVTIRMEHVATLALADAAVEFASHKHIDPSFYSADDGDPEGEDDV